MFYQELWVGYLTSIIIQKCIKLARERCPGCERKFKSALLHLHQQVSLEQKLDCYFEEVRGLLVSQIGFYFAEFEKKMGEDCVEDFKKMYIQHGKSFLFLTNARAIYYGQYINENNCEMIHSKIFSQEERASSLAEKSKTEEPEVEAIQNSKRQKLVHTKRYKTFECSDCKLRYTTKDALILHVRRTHLKTLN